MNVYDDYAYVELDRFDRDARVTELLAANNREVERRRAAEQKLADVCAALDPDLTKHAYIGDFKFDVELLDEVDEPYTQPYIVPWDTIKEIMAAIRKRAGLP
jgi:hypothetical protein